MAIIKYCCKERESGDDRVKFEGIPCSCWWAMDNSTHPDDDLVSPLEGQATEMTEAQKIAMSSALNNPLVLQKIISKLDSLLDLTSCRLVAQSWSSFSTEILRCHDLALVTIEFDPTLKIFRQSSQYTLAHPPSPTLDTEAVSANVNEEKCRQPHTSLKDLNDLLVNQHANFPCSHFIFKTVPSQGHLGEEDVQKFLKIYGQQIKTLELLNGIIPCSSQFQSLMPPLTSRQTFVQILNEWTPNVIKLVIQYFDYEWPPESIIKVPNLTEFCWRGQERLCCSGQFYEHQQFYDWTNPSPTALKVLQGAPNLRQIHRFRLADLDLVIQSGKIDTIKKLDLRYGQRLLFLAADLHKFVEAGGQLTSLYCILPKFRVRHTPHLLCLMTAYEKLIESSKDTLALLDFGSLKFNKEDPAEQNQLPCSLTLPSVMPKVKELRLGSGVHRSGRCLPATIDSKTFPNLGILDCVVLGYYEAQEAVIAANEARLASPAARILPPVQRNKGNKCPSTWDDYFPKSLTDLPSVQTLIMGANCGIEYMKKLGRLCPNFKNVVILCLAAFHQALSRVIALWPHLESIQIVLTKGHSAQFEADNFDHLFAGTPEGRSLFLNFQHLRNLEICFKGHCAKVLSQEFETKSTRAVPPMTELSAHLIFNLMPRLKVTLEYDHNCQHAEGLKSMLQSIGPHVNLAHQHNVNNEP